jgi:hypothetical protein
VTLTTANREKFMTSNDAKVLLDRMTGPVDPARPPTLPQLTEWAERVCALVPAQDCHSLLFQVSVHDNHSVAVGFLISFNNLLPVSSARDRLGLFLQRSEVAANDPIRQHDCSLSLRGYPSVAAFFAAVKADPNYQYACSYPFDEVSLYASER